jgi:predicted lipid carrier protein YhbT
MSDTTQAFFEQLAEHRYEPLLHSISGTFRWDIEGAGSWLVSVQNGSVTVSRTNAETKADCVCKCSKEDFDRMVVGKQNPTTLFLQGKMNITGNIGLALIFQRLFPNENLATTLAGA